MTGSFRVLHLREDAAGESYFDELEVSQLLTQFAPPALPFLVSSTETASGYAVISIPVGWIGKRHPSPHRQILFCLSGALKVTASDGTTRIVDTGNVWLMEDTRGKGHESEVISRVPVNAAIVFLPGSNQADRAGSRTSKKI